MRVDEIAASWMERLVRQYAGQSANFFSRTADPFRNPVGMRFRDALRVLVEELLGEMNQARVTAAVGSLMEIRAVESSTPREALGFVFELRAFADIDVSRIDELALVAFDEYARCRERIYMARLNEARRRFAVWERRAS